MVSDLAGTQTTHTAIFQISHIAYPPTRDGCIVIQAREYTKQHGWQHATMQCFGDRVANGLLATDGEDYPVTLRLLVTPSRDLSYKYTVLSLG